MPSAAIVQEIVVILREGRQKLSCDCDYGIPTRAVYKVDNKLILFNENLYSTENLIETKTMSKCNSSVHNISTPLKCIDL